MSNTDIKAIVFDLGGVLVELPGNPIKADWLTNNSKDTSDFWHTWLNSPAVHALDQGKIDANSFANQLITELQLNTSQQELIDTFRHWPRDFFDGALDLLARLKPHYTLGIYSNITELHWPRYYQTLNQHDLIHHYFASYLMGMSKPYAEGYIHVQQQMQIPAQHILFIDDNIINVNGAREQGFQAEVAKGLDQVHQIVQQYQLQLVP